MRGSIVVLLLLLAACLLAPAGAQRRRTLNDDNFEHITQASTGQTTGRWFVNFCSPSARACKDLAPQWEELAKELLPQQVAFLSTVDVHASPRLAQRFKITTLPTLLLFRDRKMYRFSSKLLPDGDAKEQLRRFITEEYASVAAEEVPPPPSALDWLAKGLRAKAAAVTAALEAQDLKTAALHVLPILLVCLLGFLLMLGASVARRNKTKRE